MLEFLQSCNFYFCFIIFFKKKVVPTNVFHCGPLYFVIPKIVLVRQIDIVNLEKISIYKLKDLQQVLFALFNIHLK